MYYISTAINIDLYKSTNLDTSMTHKSSNRILYTFTPSHHLHTWLLAAPTPPHGHAPNFCYPTLDLSAQPLRFTARRRCCPRCSRGGDWSRRSPRSLSRRPAGASRCTRCVRRYRSRARDGRHQPRGLPTPPASVQCGGGRIGGNGYSRSFSRCQSSIIELVSSFARLN